MQEWTFRAAVLTCSDSCFFYDYPDESGRRLLNHLHAVDCLDVGYAIVPDEPCTIRNLLLYWCDHDQRNLIVTTGGTGFGPRDNAPEVTRSLIEREAPGLMEYARLMTSRNHLYAYTSRGVAGVRGKSLLINLPGRPDAVDEYWAFLWPLIHHALDLLQGLTPHPHLVKTEDHE